MVKDKLLAYTQGRLHSGSILSIILADARGAATGARSRCKRATPHSRKSFRTPGPPAWQHTVWQRCRAATPWAATVASRSTVQLPRQPRSPWHPDQPYSFPSAPSPLLPPWHSNRQYSCHGGTPIGGTVQISRTASPTAPFTVDPSEGPVAQTGGAKGCAPPLIIPL